MAKNKLVCICNSVTEMEIRKILKKGARSTTDIQKLTIAGTGCGRCIREIDSLVENHLKNLKPNPQQKIEFK
jgi:bacterioferritin-associated ferredoxin